MSSPVSGSPKSTPKLPLDPTKENSADNKTQKFAKGFIRNVGFNISPETKREFSVEPIDPANPPSPPPTSPLILDVLAYDNFQPWTVVKGREKEPPKLTLDEAIDEAVRNGNSLKFKDLIGRPTADLLQRDGAGKTLLHIALDKSDRSGGYNEIVKLLIKLEPALLNARTRGLQKTPLHIAAKSYSDRKVELLLNYLPELELNAKDKYGDTPAHLAAENGDISVYYKLVAAGADTTIVNNLGLQAVLPQISVSMPVPGSDKVKDPVMFDMTYIPKQLP